jgi:tRNA-uridine 2-sulfurtransferase
MSRPVVIVALSGGVDSAVAALLLKRQGHAVQCLHMSNWEDDGYCDAAGDLRDAAAVCRRLDVPLHRVNFAREYRRQVFERFLDDLARGRTPNPDVLCNREIKFGVLKAYARRLGGDFVATGHYARLERRDGGTMLLKGRDAAKDQSYFLHAVDGRELEDVMFPLGDMLKTDVRRVADEAGLAVAAKRDSTGICFIGERPFAEFLGNYISARPGPIETPEGLEVGTHRGLAFYTLGQRQGLSIGGVHGRPESPWYVADKRHADNTLIVVQGSEHPLLYRDRLTAAEPHWICGPPDGLRGGGEIRCAARIRYRQADQPCTVRLAGRSRIDVRFDAPQRAVAPGQYVVFYDGDRCLGGATIEPADAAVDAPPGTACRETALL